jgi:16S rRNA (cytidine1402-2'-O)-methyltransferase
MPPGVLYVVATPIGNLEDVTLRALRVLREVDLVAAEDTRRTRTLLAHHGIARPVTSYYDAVERRKAPALVARLVDGASIALVTDAGTPGIADPGYHLVRGAIAAGVPVVPVPGPSALTALVSVAGIPAERFAFEGFLPSRASARAVRLRSLASEPRALVFYEATRRLDAFLADAAEILGDREAVVGRELTKRFEEIVRGRLGEIRRRLASGEPMRGEVVVLVAGAAGEVTAGPLLDDEIGEALAAGRRVSELATEIAERTGRPRREVYRRALELTRGRDSP